MRVLLVVSLLCSASAAAAQERERERGPEADAAAAAVHPRDLDPTGGPAASPTLLMTPPAGLPALALRVITGVGVQSPAGGVDAVQPHLAAELGLGRGVTVAAGSRWFGGDAGDAAVLNGLTPFAQVRLPLFGAPEGQGLLGGASLTAKRVGYRGGEPEVEAAFALALRRPRFEAGANVVFGQSLAEAGEHDVELRAFAGARPVPYLLLGAAGQVRGDVGAEEADGAVGEPRGEVDAQGGAIGSLTVGAWQLGGLVGVTTLGLRDRVGLLAELFGAVRFGGSSTRRRA